jgi:hypothetical protein
VVESLHIILPRRALDPEATSAGEFVDGHPHQYFAFPGVLGKGIASRTLESPVT